MRKFLAAPLVALLLAFGTIAVDSPAGAAPAKAAHPIETIQALDRYFDAAYFGPEFNEATTLRHKSVHYGYHYAEFCWFDNNGPDRKWHMIYNIDTGHVAWLDYDWYCPR